MVERETASVKVSTANTCDQIGIVACAWHCQFVRRSYREILRDPMQTCSCRSTSTRIELSIANVVALSDRSRALLQAQATDTHELREEVRDLRQLVDLRSRGDSFGGRPSSFLQPNVLPLHSGNSGKGADALLEGRRGLEVHLV